MSEQPKTVEDMAERAIRAAKKAMGADEDRDVYDMGSTDQGNVTNLATALIRWDAARMAAEATESRRKPIPPEVQS